ncbi:MULTISPECIES: hypothetical protein [unclassified Pseudomonas]|uniref:hypothetical protein n=1 Tax=unclassified Pseudomonas TaxID=196821 RepID=UPI00026FEC5A|nr:MULTISPECIES: hypothetical protein [unclassified Pseudomonas]EJL99735.1 hypothetical protein PMI19_04019 [Pseudomonas sp. GM16]EJM44730.1 hypothetical protein PMI23_00724 [Pseudomonas sp. GM24]
MITEGESEGVLITSITTPVNNAYVRNGDIFVAGNSDVNFPIVLRMFSVNDEVAAETITPKNGRWDTVIKGVFRPGQYRLELQPVGGVKVTVNLRVTPVTIISPVSGEEVDEQFSIRGAGGEYGLGAVRVHNASTGGVLGNADIQPDGTWEKRLTLSGNSASYFATQIIGDFPSPLSATINVTSRSTPVITSPVEPLQNCSFSIGGTQGWPGSVMQIFKDLSTIQVGEDAVSAANWFAPVIVEPGPVSLVAMQTFGGVPSKRSAPRSFRIRPPKLAEPEVTFLPDTSLKFSGSGHFDQNLSTEIQFSASDGSLPLPSNVRVNAQGYWETAPVVWSLGSYDVTLIQKIADNASGWIESQPLEFKVCNDMPDITEASYTEEYLPVFSGKGYTGATVSLRFPDTNEAARSVVVVNGQWSTSALVEWGPTNKREVRITQHLGNHPSQRPFILYVTIPPLAPGVDDLGEEGLEPVFRGTCLSGATVSIRFSDDTETHVATVTGSTWTFQRPTPFEANIEHAAEVTQTILDLLSKPTSKTFTVHRVMLQPLIVAPGSGSEVGFDVTIEGDNGMQGAVMQLHDNQIGATLGDPLELLEEGKWSIQLLGLDLREYFLHAQQTLNGRDSANSAEHRLKVVVPPPRFTTPIPGGRAPRTSKIAGTGRATARVEVWLEGATEPLLTDIEVNASGNWDAEVSLPVGNTTIWAFQTFVHDGIAQRSQANERLRYKVVPAAPFIETPTADDHVGRRVVVSGFATPGDTVTVTLGSDQASAEVRENRTWSVTLEPGQDEGNHELDAVAACEGFISDSAKRTLQLATYLPTVEIPEPGRWVSNPVLFAGKGRQGVGVLVDPFNPDKTWLASIQVDPDWQGLSDQTLPLGGNWCRFKLQPSDSDPMGSDWVVSERFEIESVPTDKIRL